VAVYLDSEMMEVEGVLSDLEGRFLADMASRAPGLILEIGSYKGRSTCYLASKTDNMVVALDLWDMRPEGFKPSKKVSQRGYYKPETFKMFKENIKKQGLINVLPVKGDSREIGKIWNLDLGMLWIDGDHTYAGALSDYRHFSCFVQPGGYIAFHDYVIKDVRKVIEESVIPSGLWEDYKLVDTVWAATRKPKDE